MLQFLSHPEEFEVNERILTAILCKPGVSVPYNLHHDAANRMTGAVAAAVRDVTPDSFVAILQSYKQSSSV
jgi:hypothetical protein